MRRLAKITVLCSLVGALALAGAGDAVARGVKVPVVEVPVVKVPIVKVPVVKVPIVKVPAGDPATVSFIGITNGGTRSTADHFAPGDTATIVVVVTWRTLVGHHRQRLELITPDGSIYQQFRRNVASSSGEVVNKTRVRVAGTWMTEYQLYGEWTVNVYLDGTAKPVTSGHFTLSH